MLKIRILKTTGAVCFALLALASCRPEEQGRPIEYHQGVFPGKNPSQPFSEEALANLRQRALEQAGEPAGGIQGGGGPGTDSSVRPPETAVGNALGERIMKQSGN